MYNLYFFHIVIVVPFFYFQYLCDINIIEY